MLLVDEKTSLYRGNRPKDLNEVKNAGIKRIISLESGIYDLFHADQTVERQFPCEFGMDQYDMKSSDFTAPEDWVVLKFLALVRDEKPTLVHCLSGVDRTGFVCAAYRMQVQGWSFQQARDEWVNLGRHPWYFIWESKLKKWESK